MSEVKAEETAVKTEEQIAQEKLDALAKLFKSECTGQVEPWRGKSGPMFNVFLKNGGKTTSPVKGTNTIKELIELTLKSLKNSSYFIRFKFNVADGSGGFTEQNATLISVVDGGYMVFAGRERINATFDVSVDKVIKKTKKIEGLEPTSDDEKIEIDFSTFSKAKTAGIEIV
jgi:hypothetical protein